MSLLMTEIEGNKNRSQFFPSSLCYLHLCKKSFALNFPKRKNILANTWDLCGASWEKKKENMWKRQEKVLFRNSRLSSFVAFSDRKAHVFLGDSSKTVHKANFTHTKMKAKRKIIFIFKHFLSFWAINKQRIEFSDTIFIFSRWNSKIFQFLDACETVNLWEKNSAKTVKILNFFSLFLVIFWVEFLRKIAQ